MRVVLTGADGFLGWHTRLRIHALTEHEVVPLTRRTWGRLPAEVGTADAIIHIAGANRGPDSEVEATNVGLARDVAAAIAAADRPVRVIMAGTIQAGGDTAYGRSKARAAALLAAATPSASRFIDVQLPNLFGPHGRPHYNSFVATFIESVINGATPRVANSEVGLLAVQSAAGSLIGALSDTAVNVPAVTRIAVRDVWELLRHFHATYRTGEIPALIDDFRIDLFNAYRAALFPARYPISLMPHEDRRGRFVETVRVRGGQGQSSVSTTLPGVTRGEHYHLRKVERFVVVEGRARIALRRMFTDRVVAFDVSGEDPTAVDMPVGWAHNITNVGPNTLITQFWSHELFRPEAPDTFPEPVEHASGESS